MHFSKKWQCSYLNNSICTTLFPLSLPFTSCCTSPLVFSLLIALHFLLCFMTVVCSISYFILKINCSKIIIYFSRLSHDLLQCAWVFKPPFHSSSLDECVLVYCCILFGLPLTSASQVNFLLDSCALYFLFHTAHRTCFKPNHTYPHRRSKQAIKIFINLKHSLRLSSLFSPPSVLHHGCGSR